MAAKQGKALALVAGILIASAACSHDASAQANGRKKKLPGINSPSAAIDRANRLTGLNELTTVAEAQRFVIRSSNLPFLAAQVIGKAAWQVSYGKSALKLKSVAPGFHDQFPREFQVVLLEDTGQLVSVLAPYKGIAPEMREPPSAASAERQLRGDAEMYTGLPYEDPEFNFLQALDVVLTRGSGSPLLAKAIDAVYVMDTSMGTAPHPAWAITLRGLPPFQARGAHGNSVPEWQRNHMRNVIDALTGALLFSTNTPQPVE